MLKNKPYLFLLAYYNEEKMPSYQTLGEKIGMSRQTVSKKIKELENDKYIEIDNEGYVFVDNSLNILEDELRIILEKNNYKIEDIVKLVEDSEKYTKTELARKLHMSRMALYQEETKPDFCVVYGIISEGILKYIGSSDRYDERIKEHILKRPFLTRDNFCVLQMCSSKDMLNIEKRLIKTLQPEWNIMSK